MNYFKIDNMFIITFKYIISNYEKEGKINKDTTLIYPSLGNDILEIDELASKLDNKVIIIRDNDIDEEILNKINNKDLILIPPFGFDNLIEMANDMKLEIDNSIVINLFEEKLGISYYYKEYSKEIFKKYNEIDTLIIPLDYPFLSGIAKYYRMKLEDIKIIGIKNKYKSNIIDYDLFDEIIDDIDLNKYGSNSLYIKY